jgi:hypothetical protein
MADIRASEIKEKMRIRQYGLDDDDALTVATIGWHGATVLVTSAEGNKYTYDRDEVLELMPVKLVCPVCGSGDALTSWEIGSIGFSKTRFFQDPDNPGEPEIDYTSADTTSADDGGPEFVDDIQCDNHDFKILQLSVEDLVPEGTPPNPDWQPPADRPIKVSDQDAMDQIAALLATRHKSLTLSKVVEVVCSTGRNIEGSSNG